MERKRGDVVKKGIWKERGRIWKNMGYMGKRGRIWEKQRGNGKTDGGYGENIGVTGTK